MHDPGSTRVRQEFGAIAEQAARRNAIQQTHESLPRILHLEHLAAPRPELFDHRAEEFLRDVDRQLFVRLETLTARTLARDHTRPRDLELDSPGPPGPHQNRDSYPARRMVSIRIVRCSSPRPETVQVSVDSVSSTRNATFLSSSRYSRSRTCRDVTNFPSRPANGELLTRKSTEIVGSSTAIPSRRSGCSTSVTVSPISTLSRPASATMSPASAC